MPVSMEVFNSYTPLRSSSGGGIGQAKGTNNNKLCFSRARDSRQRRRCVELRSPVATATIERTTRNGAVVERDQKAVKFMARAVVTVRRKRKEDVKERIANQLDAYGDRIVGRGVLLELVGTEIDPKTGGPKSSKRVPLKGWFDKKDLKAEKVVYTAEFMVDSTFGEPGAITVLNRHHREFYLESIEVQGFPTGTAHFTCDSWVQPTRIQPDKRVFFSNKPYLPSETPLGLRRLRETELMELRGDGKGERKMTDRIYDYDIYNDLGNPDKGTELVRPTIGGNKDLPYPRRLRTGRSAAETDEMSESRVEYPDPIYIPRDEEFEEKKLEMLADGDVKALLHNLVPLLVSSLSPETNDFKGFHDIDNLFKEGLRLKQALQDYLLEKIPFVTKIQESSEGLLRYDTPLILRKDKFAWLRDDEFARQSLAGINPVNIERLQAFPPVSKLDPDLYGPPESAIKEEHIIGHLNGMSVQQALEDNRLYMLDFHDIYLPFLDKINAQDGRKAYGTRTIFFLTDLGTLKPIAIELSLPPATPNCARAKRVMTPPTDATSNWLWQLAKAHVCSNDAGVHQLVNHWLRTHACMEPFIIAAHRQLSRCVVRLSNKNPTYNQSIDRSTCDSPCRHRRRAPARSHAMVALSADVSSRIRLLVDSLNESNSDAIRAELCEVADREPEGCVLVLKACFEQVKLTGEGDAQSALHRRDLFSNIFRHLLGKPCFNTNFCEALKTVQTNEQFLQDLSNAFKLSAPEKSGVGLALLDSDNVDLRLRGHNFIFDQIDELYENPSLAILDARIQEIAVFILQNKDSFKHTDCFEKICSYLQLNGSPFTVPSLNSKDEIYPAAPLRIWNHYVSSSDEDLDAYLAEIEKETSSPDMITEFGYGCTASMDHCKFVLSLFQPLNDVMVAKLVGAMTRSRTGLDDSNNTFATFLSAVGSSLTSDTTSPSTWDIGNFVGSVKQVAPSTDWKNVMENLDHEGFIVPDEAAFNFLMSLYNRACQDPFPLNAVCGSVWSNTEGQLSFLKYAVSASPDVFTFAHCTHQLAFSEVAYLKQGNQAWFCLDLIQVLCQLAEQGHATAVRGILSSSIGHCAGVLLLGVSQIKTAYNLIQDEVVSCTLPMVLKDSTKMSIIGCLWRVNPQLVIKGFLEVYKDTSHLIRISTVCSELKILPVVLDSVPFSFSIRLASVAAAKEQIILEKWLTESLEKHKEAFCEECMKFLKEASTELSDGTQATVAYNYKEMLATFLKLLQSYSGPLMSEQLSEEINKLMSSLPISSYYGTSEVGAEQPRATEEVDDEANSYFHQMFSGQLSIEQMVQMLSRFKESSDQREQMIFNCMIANLFEEYKFFPKYPDKQLKLAAVLFGALIKHQLVTHLALGIALRGVLDALRKSVDSKMFIFGTKALEQFMDRLVEWPQYCNHILQISHLRGTHPELVVVIERTLARVSSSQNEPNGSVASLSFEQHGSVPASIESMEASEASWQLVGAASSQLGCQVSSFQMPQQRPPPQGFLGERLKPASPITTNQTKSVISTMSQAAVSSTSNESTPNAVKPSATPSLLAPSHSANVSSAASSGGIRTRNLATSGVLRQTSYSTGFGAALNIETLVAAAEQRDAQIEAPSTEVQDKILFIVNNISTSNMEAKAKEFNEVLQEQYFPWFAQYMVMKRASIEPNFHDLYLKFLDKVNSKALNKEILKATYENCKVLLRSDLIKSSSEERSLLKNLGSWLGKFTIGRNQALRAKEIDPKSLIIEAYERGLMIAVIPFTSKILEPCQSSIAYRPPNPWTMGILSLLAEIYGQPNLKMNLKFDIEVLFKNLGVDIKEVKPATLITSRRREPEGNPDFSTKDITTVSQPPIVTETSIPVPGNHADLPPEVSSISGRSNLSTIVNQYAEPGHHGAVPTHAAGPAHYAAGPAHHTATRYGGSLHLAHGALVEEDKVGPLVMPEQVPSPHNIPQVVTPSPAPSPSPSPFSLNQLMQAIPRADTYFRINPKLSTVGGSQVPYARLIEAAMDKSVKEIISPVIQRSVTIASRTAKELILKDYATEPDDGVIFRAAHLMVGTLAGSLAHVTCKEPLRGALTSNLRTMLQSLNSNNDNNEQIIQILITDHLDLGCALIESVATRKAVEIIDSDIGQSLAQLRKQREAAGSAYYDAFTFAQGSYSRVPDALRPKPGQLSNSQSRVYEDFVNVWQSQGGQNSSAVAGSQATGTSGTGSTVASSSVAPRAYSPGPLQTGAGAHPGPAQTTVFAPPPLDIPSDELENTSSQTLNIVTSESAVSNAAAQLTARVASPDLPLAENAPSTKDLGLLVPPSPTPVVDRLGTITPEPLSTGDALERYQQVSQKLEALIAKDGRDSEIQAVVSEVPDIILRCVSRDEAALAVAQKVFRSLYENASNGVHVASYLAILVAIRDVCKLAVKELTSWVIYSDEEKKFNVEITIGLIRSELLNLGEYNLHLAKLIDGGRNKAATEFAIALVQTLVTQESGVFISELFNVVDVLSKIASRPGAPESLQQLIEIVRSNNAPSKDEKARQSRDKKVLSGRPIGTKEDGTSSEATALLPDPVGFQDQVAVLFSEWCQLCDLPVANDMAYSHYISQLQQTGLLKGDDITDRFFRVLTELSVAHSVVKESTALGAVQNHANEQISFFPIDSYGKLIVVILKYASADQVPNKGQLLYRFLLVTAKVLVKDAEEKKTDFNARPFFRLFVNWLLDFVSPDVDGANFQVLIFFANTLFLVQPLRVPSFSFAWLELLCHKNFMPKILTCNSPKGWPHFQRLLVSLFKFVEPFLRKSQLPEPVVLLYKGILKMMLVLLHDFPEFLCDYHFSLCDVIPATCIQLRNLILSAFPRNMRLPDPSTPNLKIDLLPEIVQPPRILSDVEAALQDKKFKSEIDEYLKSQTRPEGPFLSELKQKLLLPTSEVTRAGTRYNVPLINSLVLYIGMQAIQQLQSKNTSAQQMNQMDIFLVGAAMDIYQSLVKNLDTEGRYYFVNAICNQLRYPNNHTHYFSFVLLYLWAEASSDLIQEQITRVLLERLIVNRPHPWGLLITFIEMIKNPRYNFWNRPFTRVAPDIEKLFESVSRSCGAGPIAKSLEDVHTSAGVPDVNH